MDTSGLRTVDAEAIGGGPKDRGAGQGTRSLSRARLRPAGDRRRVSVADLRQRRLDALLEDAVRAEVFAFDMAGGRFVQRAAGNQADDLGAGDVHAESGRLALHRGKRL